MLRETTEHSEKSFLQYPTKDLVLLDSEELAVLFQDCKQLVSLSLSIGNQLRKLALQSPEVQLRGSL